MEKNKTRIFVPWNLILRTFTTTTTILMKPTKKQQNVIVTQKKDKKSQQIALSERTNVFPWTLKRRKMIDTFILLLKPSSLFQFFPKLFFYNCCCCFFSAASCSPWKGSPGKTFVKTSWSIDRPCWSICWSDANAVGAATKLNFCHTLREFFPFCCKLTQEL